MDTNQLIQQSIEQGKIGNKTEARRILAQVVQQEPKNARAWYLLSQVVEKQDQAVYCLNKVLEIDPQNQQAAERLRQNKMTTSPQAEEAQVPAAPTPPPVQPSTAVKPKRKTQWWVYVLLILAVPILACMCFGMFSAAISDITGNDPSDNVVNPLKLTHEVVYRVEGGAQSAAVCQVLCKFSFSLVS